MNIIQKIFNLGIVDDEVSLEEKHSIKLINQISFFIIVLTILSDIGEISTMGWQLIVHTIVFKLGFVLVLYLNFKRKTNAASILFSFMLLFELCSVPFLVPHTLNADGLFLSIIVLIGAVTRKAITIIVFALIDISILITWHVADHYSLISPMNIFKPEEELFIEISYSIVMMATLLIGLLSFKRSAKGFQTELTQTNRSLEFANKDLERQHLLNQKIFSVISHDFRGPMLSLNLMLDSFKTKSTDATLNGFVQNVNTEVSNATEMLNNLLNWARTEINIKNFEKQSCKVLPIYTETCKELKSKLEQKQLTLKSSISAEDEIKLPPDILRIALRNLLSNAIKFSYNDAIIEVAYIKSTEGILVTDHGIGMDNTTQSKLFKKEVNPELGTSNEEGFGVGLYIVSELLNKYQFKIQFESKPGNGSCFSILPKEC